jgi:lipoate-protein ligase B
VVEYVKKLEEVMIRTAAEWEVQARRDRLNRGIWVGKNKLGSVGIAVRRGISFHGFALNVNTDLEPFGWINPCGLEGIGVTSMARELSKDISMSRIRATIKRHIQAVFKVNLVDTDLEALLVPQRPAEGFILKPPGQADLNLRLI